MRWLVIGAVIIVLYDAVTALGSRWLAYEYGGWPDVLGSGAILAVSAFLAARDAGTRRAGTATAAGVALVDVLVGWPISGAIIPGYFPSGAVTDVFATIVAVSLVGAAMGAAIGFIAGTLGTRRGTVRKVPNS